MTRPLLPQQRFSVFVTKPNKIGERLEITNDVDSVTLEIDQDQISVLTFYLNNPEKHSEYMDVGYHIDFYGGYIDHYNYANTRQSDNNSIFTYDTKSSDQYKYMFNGRVFWIKILYLPGSEQLRIICKDMSWGATASSLPHYAYPSKNCPRSFAINDELNLTELVRGICIAIDMDLYIRLAPAQENIEFTYKRAAIQKGITDWAFLRQLAKNSGCYIWTAMDTDTGKYTLYFVDKDIAVNKNDSRIEFIWLGRKDNFEFKEGLYLSSDSSDGSEISKFKSNQIQLNEIEVDINPMIAGTNITQVTDFDDKTGQEVTKLVSYEEESGDIFYYELDKAKVEKLVRTNPEEANRIQNMGAFGIDRTTFLEYYIKVPIPKGIKNCIDRPYHGISVSTKIDGDISIEPFQSYRIYGIGKWSSRTNHKALNYYLYSIEHSWGSNSFETSLKFKA